MAREYTGWRFFQLFPLLMFVASRGYLQAVGLPWVMFASTVIANVVNSVDAVETLDCREGLDGSASWVGA